MPRVAALLLCVLLLALMPLSAQTVVGRISGTITDATGAIVPNVDVIITNTDTQVVRTVKADDNGFYVATSLPIGRYAVTVEQAGFKRVERSGITLVADGRVTADIQLTVGDTSQSIEVQATAAEVVNTVSGEVSRVVDTQQVQSLALNGRNFIQLATLIPGSVVTEADQMNLTTSLSASNQNINGNRGNSTNQMVDGAYNLVAGSNGSLVNNVGVDFIREVKIQTSNFSAEYGRNSGAAVNVMTRSGSNDFHGSAFEYFRNDQLDARNFFSTTVPKLRFNDFGWSFGGPIKKNRLFFFGGQEWKKIRRDTQPSRKTLPTTAQLNGDFSNLSTPIYYPGTTNPFPNNKIPTSMITADGRAIGNVYSTMEGLATAFTNMPTANNATYQLANPFDFREDIVRIDYNINDKHSLWGRYIGDNYDLIEPLGTFSSGLLPTVPTNRLRPGKTYAVGHTWMLSPTLINEARASTSWAAQRIPPVGDYWKRGTYNFQFPEIYQGGLYPGSIPNVSIQNYTGFQGAHFGLVSPSTDIQASETLTWIKGSHIFKGGFTIIRDRIDQNGRPQYNGNVNFNPVGNSNTTGNAMADALLGNFRDYSEYSGDPMGFFRFSQYEAFIQDSWKVTRKVSLELGVRYQYGQPMYTQADNLVNFDPALYNPANAVTVNRDGTVVAGSGNRYNGLIRAGSGIPADELARVPNAISPDIPLVPTGAPRGLYDGEHRFAPRIGISFAVNDKTVIRSGFGIFYDRPEGNILFSEVNTPPYLSNSKYENGNLGNPAGGTLSALAPFASINAIDPNLSTPYSEQFSLGVQRDLPWSMFLEATYVGNLGRHLLRQPDVNQVPFDLNAANAALPSSQRRATNALRPYKGFAEIRQYLSDSTSNYHSMQWFLSKRAGRMTGTFAYTWSKALGDASGNGDNPENYYNRHFNYGPLSFDRTHVIVGTTTMQMPELKNSFKALRMVAGGWELSGIFRFQTGQPLSPSADTVTGNRRADYISGSYYVDESSRTVNNWLVKSAFGVPGNGKFGNAGTGIIRGPGKQIFDISLRKNFAVTERVAFRVQADFFNLFNITNFGNPNTNISNAAWGTISGADPGRNIQLGAKVTF